MFIITYLPASTRRAFIFPCKPIFLSGICPINNIPTACFIIARENDELDPIGKCNYLIHTKRHWKVKFLKAVTEKCTFSPSSSKYGEKNYRCPKNSLSCSQIFTQYIYK